MNRLIATGVLAAVVVVAGCATGTQATTSSPHKLTAPARSVGSFAAPSPRPASTATGAVLPDFQGHPARPCQVLRAGQLPVVRIEPDVPEPACWQVSRFGAIRVLNATGDFHQRPRVVVGALRGVGSFRLEPGDSVILQLAHGHSFAEGDHCITVDTYPGSCLAIWVTTSGE